AYSVRVLPSIRTWTVAASAVAGSTNERAISASSRLATIPPSARGSISGRATGRSSDSGLPLRRLPELALSGFVAEGISPHSGGTVPDLHRVPSPFVLWATESSMGRNVVSLAPRDRLGGGDLRVLVDPVAQ